MGQKIWTPWMSSFMNFDNEPFALNTPHISSNLSQIHTFIATNTFLTLLLRAKLHESRTMHVICILHHSFPLGMSSHSHYTLLALASPKKIREIHLLFIVPLPKVFYGQRNYENLEKMWKKDGNWVLNSGFLAYLVTKKAKEKKRKLSKMKIN